MAAFSSVPDDDFAGRPVAIWDIEGDAARKTAAELSDRFGVATASTEIDVRDSSRFAEAIDESRRILGSIGGLVHAAGVVRTISIEEVDEKNWEEVLEVNLRAHALLVRALIPELRSHAGSAVVGIASIVALELTALKEEKQGN